MKDEDKTKEQLIRELAEMRRRISELEASEVEHKRAEEQLSKHRDHFEELVKGHTAEVQGEIAERRKTEKELRILSRAVKQSPATVVITDSEGTIEYVNPKFVQLTGYTFKEAIGQNPRILKSGKQSPEFYQELWETITHGKEWRGGFYNKKKNGDFYWEFASISPIKNEEGIITHFVGVKEDITERKQAEENLRESEEKYRALFNEARDGIVIIDNETGNIVECNSEFENQTGRKLEQLRKMKIWEIRVPEKIELAKKKFLEVKEKGEGGSRELEFQKPDGKVIPIEFLSRVVKIRGREYLQSIVRDITQRKRAEETIRELAYHDSLTGLPNRMLFNDRLTLELAHAHRNRQKFGVMMLDLDYFKDINDTLGHGMGDQLLQAVGRRLTGLLRKNDTVARMGGDEFLLLLPEIAGMEAAVKIAQKILKVVRKPFVIDGHKLQITTSIGIATYPRDGKDGDTLMTYADNAMYRAKKEGRDNYNSYSVKKETVRSGSSMESIAG